MSLKTRSKLIGVLVIVGPKQLILLGFLLLKNDGKEKI
jgi:hypothetical protein